MPGFAGYRRLGPYRREGLLRDQGPLGFSAGNNLERKGGKPMAYQKPQIVVLPSAKNAIQGKAKGTTHNPDLTAYLSVGAYEADE